MPESLDEDVRVSGPCPERCRDRTDQPSVRSSTPVPTPTATAIARPSGLMLSSRSCMSKPSRPPDCHNGTKHSTRPEPADVCAGG